jgi:hypothetical protein
MEERAKRATKQEPYTYSLYVPSQKSEHPRVELGMRNPEAYIGEEPEVAEDSSSMLGLEGSVQESTTEGALRSQDLVSTRSQRIYRPKHQSSGKTSSFSGMLHFRGNMRIRIGVTAGWSALAGAGAAALLTRTGPFPGTPLAELGAVWAGVTAFLWIVVAKLAK